MMKDMPGQEVTVFRFYGARCLGAKSQKNISNPYPTADNRHGQMIIIEDDMQSRTRAMPPLDSSPI